MMYTDIISFKVRIDGRPMNVLIDLYYHYNEIQDCLIPDTWNVHDSSGILVMLPDEADFEVQQYIDTWLLNNFSRYYDGYRV